MSPILDPLLTPLIPRGTIADREDWFAPALGLLLEGGLSGRLGYAVKLDAAGFGVGPDDYRSAAVFLTCRLGSNWLLAGGFRDARFKAKPGGDEDLSLDLHVAGPKLGLAYSF